MCTWDMPHPWDMSETGSNSLHRTCHTPCLDLTNCHRSNIATPADHCLHSKHKTNYVSSICLIWTNFCAMMPTFNDRLEFFEPLEPRRGVSGSSLDFWVVVFVVLIGLLVVPICLLGDGRFLSAPTYPLQRSVSQRQPLTRDNELSEMSRGLHVLVTVSGDWTGPIKTDLLKHSRTIPVLDLQRNHWLLQDIQYQYWFIASYNDLISGTMSFLDVCG